MESCQLCSIPLDRSTSRSWQHLANNRDARRVYCESCNNLALKNLECKISGQAELGTNPAVPESQNTSSPGSKASNPESPKSRKTKLLEGLAEVEFGVIKPEEFSKQRNPGRVSVWAVGVCGQYYQALSGWLTPSSSHLPTGLIRLWDSEVVTLHQLFRHLLLEHSSTDWSDQLFEGERLKLEQVVKDHENRVEREEQEEKVQQLMVKTLPCQQLLDQFKMGELKDIIVRAIQDIRWSRDEIDSAMTLIAILPSVDYPKWTLSVTKVALGDRRNEAILDGEVVGIDTDLNFVQAISNI